ncbi:DUF6455 family protein [Rhodosalinus sp. 5P4]|uniref:DUF6455 family protein n=1 Tax=Rhodosalinus sp. 5P4 TaxID=3239196 RepID=UPI003526C2C3
MPRPLGPPGRHYWLLQRMARVTGADTAGAWARGWLSAPDWRDMVDRCRACDRLERCGRWLDLHERENCPAVAPPRGCRNSERLSRLSQPEKEATQP